MNIGGNFVYLRVKKTHIMKIKTGIGIDVHRLEVTTPDVTIRVNPERQDLVETRFIGGAKYILIRADDTVEVNGVNIHIADGSDNA